MSKFSMKASNIPSKQTPKTDALVKEGISFAASIRKIINNKLIRIGMVINLIYLIVGIIFYFYSPTGNDFSVYYKSGYLAIHDPQKLYDPNEYYLPFRYLPLSAYVFSLLSILPEHISYILFMITNYFINIIISALIYHYSINILKIDKEKGDGILMKLIMLYLLYLPHADNYINGQVNLIVLLLLFLSLYFLTTDDSGISIMSLESLNYIRHLERKNGEILGNKNNSQYLGRHNKDKITSQNIELNGSDNNNYNNNSDNNNYNNNSDNNNTKANNGTSELVIKKLKIFFNNQYIMDFIGGLLFALAVLIKITAILILPFIILIKLRVRSVEADGKSGIDKGLLKHRGKDEFRYKNSGIYFPLKRNIIRLIIPIIFISANFILFIEVKGLWSSFLGVNLSGDASQVNYHSFSVTRIIINILIILGIKFNSLLIMLSIFIPLFIITFVLFIYKGVKQNILIEFYTLGLLVVLLGYYDSWVHHLVVIAPFVTLILVKLKKRIIERENFFDNINTTKGARGANQGVNQKAANQGVNQEDISRANSDKYINYGYNSSNHNPNNNSDKSITYYNNNNKHKENNHNLYGNDNGANILKKNPSLLGEYYGLMKIYILNGIWIWMLCYILTRNIFYPNSPGFNVLYTIMVFLLYVKILKVVISTE